MSVISIVDRTKSKTDQAIEYMHANQCTVYAAAKALAISASAIYRRIGVLAATADKRCPCCGQIVQKSI